MSALAGEGLVSGLRPGAAVTVRVPASSANLGPGFDSLGLALRVHDVVSLRITPEPGVEVDVEGEGVTGVPRDERHLVVRAVRAAFDYLGLPQPGLRLSCLNTIPHGKGLGSSASAVVAGLIAARGCLADPSLLDDETILGLGTAFEGHPDNVAASLLGGATVAWRDPDGMPHAVRLGLHPELDAVLAVPAVDLPTSRARAMLPAEVPHADAAFTAGRAALLVEALTRRPDLLRAATEERLHQAQRAPAMPGSAALLDRVRARGGAAVVSGAGPAVLVLGRGDEAADAVAGALSELSPGGAGDYAGWAVLRPGIDNVGALATTDGD